MDVAWGQHSYTDLSDLNAKWDQARPAVAGLGTSNGILSGNSLQVPASGLGADPTYPWGEYSADTAALQREVNDALKSNGDAAIDADGKLGPKTCGAIKAMCGTVSSPCSAPATCKTFTSPSKLGGGSSSPTTMPGSSTTHAAMLGGGPNWLLIGGAVAAVAVGGALLFKASKGRR